MPKISLHELAQSARGGQVEQSKRYMVGVAEAIYQNPGHFGFRNLDEIGDAFCLYWKRIQAFPDRYLDNGASFDAYLTSSMRYIALSIRRTRAREFDRQSVCCEEQYRSYSETCCSELEAKDWNADCFCPGAARSIRPGLFPEAEDTSVSARAFRVRLIYLCIKCAQLLDDSRLLVLSRLADVDTETLMRWVQVARHEMSIHGIRTSSRRKGRDSAWVRIGINRRRLTREVDPERRQELTARIERDHGVYVRACRVIHNSRPMLSNKRVAEIMGVSKATVDSGVRRILERYFPLYADEDT